MRISLATSLLGGGIGFFGRFFLALAIIVILKGINKNDKELDRGLKLLVIFGIVAVVLLMVLATVWLGLFRSIFSFSPFTFSYYYH